MRRFENFIDEEVYILSRQAMEASYEIQMTGRYGEKEKRTHGKLLNEIIAEAKVRGL